MTRVAAIDCGTNSIRLLIVDVVGDRLVDVTRQMEIVRLGQDVDRTGLLAPDALDRTFTALRTYADTIAAAGVQRTRMVATSATRDAANRAEFVSGCTAILGLAPEVVTGAEEARLSFHGATKGLDRRHPGPYLVVDIGGGSTELVLGDDTVEQSRSVEIGCVRLHERRLASDPPTAEQIHAAEADVDAALALVDQTVDVRRARTLVGVAGTVTTVAALALGLPSYDPTAIHGGVIAAADIDRITGELLAMRVEQRRALTVMHPGRADVIGSGALVLRRIVQHVGVAAVVASEHDILDGIAWSLVDPTP